MCNYLYCVYLFLLTEDIIKSYNFLLDFKCDPNHADYIIFTVLLSLYTTPVGIKENYFQ